MDATNAKSQQLGRGKILIKPRAEENRIKVRSPLSPTTGFASLSSYPRLCWYTCALGTVNVRRKIFKK